MEDKNTRYENRNEKNYQTNYGQLKKLKSHKKYTTK
jgi:hypothetical protein